MRFSMSSPSLFIMMHSSIETAHSLFYSYHQLMALQHGRSEQDYYSLNISIAS